MEERSGTESGPEEPHAVDADRLPQEAFGGDVQALRGEVIDDVDGMPIRYVFDDSGQILPVEPTPEADFTKDFPEVADVG